MKSAITWDAATHEEALLATDDKSVDAYFPEEPPEQRTRFIPQSETESEDR
jgi:hypothetical protein